MSNSDSDGKELLRDSKINWVFITILCTVWCNWMFIFKPKHMSNKKVNTAYPLTPLVVWFFPCYDKKKYLPRAKSSTESKIHENIKSIEKRGLSVG